VARDYPGAIWSVSLGQCEDIFSPTDLAAADSAVAAAERAGTTAFAASGDEGGLECLGAAGQRAQRRARLRDARGQPRLYPGYGEAFQVTPSSADGNPVSFEVTIICAIRDGYAICAYAVGPQVSLGHLVTHPTEARLALALWADPDLNGVRWKGQGLP